MAGRKSKLNRDLIDRAEKLLNAGNYTKVVCGYLGITYQTWYMWLNQGEEDRENGKKGLKCEFFERVKKAEASAEMRAVTGILQAGEENWTAYAWFLERKHHDRWAKRDKTEVSGKDGGAIEIESDMKDKLVERLLSIKKSGEDDA